MPTVIVSDGDFESALEKFKTEVNKEGILSKYNQRQRFSSFHEIRALKAYKQERRKRRGQTH